MLRRHYLVPYFSFRSTVEFSNTGIRFSKRPSAGQNFDVWFGIWNSTIEFGAKRIWATVLVPPNFDQIPRARFNGEKFFFQIAVRVRSYDSRRGEFSRSFERCSEKVFTQNSFFGRETNEINSLRAVGAYVGTRKGLALSQRANIFHLRDFYRFFFHFPYIFFAYAITFCRRRNE